MKNPNAERDNPCIAEQKLTYKCFNDHNFDKSACELEITNYKVCKEFWDFVKKDRRRRGLRPAIPPVEERAQVKLEYMKRAQH